MNIAKLTEEQLRATFPPDVLMRAEGSVGQFYNCTVRNGDLYGQIKGNHGTYDVTLRISQSPIPFENKKDEKYGSPKHAAALGLTYIYTPWVFKSEDQIDRNNLKTFDDIQFYVAITPLRQLVNELKTVNISLGKLAELTRIPLNQISTVIKDSDNDIPHALTEPLKLACLYLLENININKNECHNN
jgi:hypothetical protein